MKNQLFNMSRGYQRPENAISKADEFIKVGKFELLKKTLRILKLTFFCPNFRETNESFGHALRCHQVQKTEPQLLRETH